MSNQKHNEIFISHEILDFSKESFSLLMGLKMSCTSLDSLWRELLFFLI